MVSHRVSLSLAEPAELPPPEQSPENERPGASPVLRALATAEAPRSRHAGRQSRRDAGSRELSPSEARARMRSAHRPHPLDCDGDTVP